MSTKARKAPGKASNKPSSKSKAPSSSKTKVESGVECIECSKQIAALDQALFVEEEVGRFFCCEACIVANFTADIEKLEREYGRHVSAHDLNAQEREKYAHLRWLTLEQPEEMWREKTASGDYRYTLVTEFNPDGKPIYAVAICLMLHEEPSFLYLAFITNDKNLVSIFKRGEKMKVIRKDDPMSTTMPEQGGADAAPEKPASSHDRLAEQWTEADSLQASVIKNRKTNDIPIEDFGFYQSCLEETLQEPTELWSYLPKAAKRVYYFIRHYTHDQDYWYVVMAKDTVDETQIEIVDAFPTTDTNLVQICRHGRKEALGEKPGEENGMRLSEDKIRRNVH